MDKRYSNLPVYSLTLSVVPWLFAIFAELLWPAAAKIVVPLAYLSFLASMTMAVIVIRRKSDQNVLLAWIAVVSNILFALLMVVSFFASR